MVSLKQSLVALGYIVSVTAVDIVVSSAGGNVTGSQGHPFGYGFLHEVRTSSQSCQYEGLQSGASSQQFSPVVHVEPC